MNRTITEKMNDLFKNEDFCVQFFDALNDNNKLNTVLQNSGINVSEDELSQIINLAKNQVAKEENGEMNEDELENVSGGVVGWVIAGVASGIFFGYQTYKAKKALNEATGYCK